jgi:hypothetical protein
MASALSVDDQPVSTGWPPPMTLRLFGTTRAIDRQVALKNGCWSTAHWIFPALIASTSSALCRVPIWPCCRSRLAAAASDGCSQGDDVVDRRVLLQFRGDVDARRHVGAVDVEVLDGAAKAGFHTGATGFEGDVSLVLDDADDLACPFGGQSLVVGS